MLRGIEIVLRDGSDRMTLLPALALGFVLGLRHATDADHVVAITTLVSRERSTRAALSLGAFWGFGHTLTLLCVGGAVVAFGLVITPTLGSSLEMSVAVMLMLLGVFNLANGRAAAPDVARTAPESCVGQRTSLGRLALGVLRRGARPLAIGIVHGLAGSAAVALLVLTTIKDVRSALVYLGVFGAGTIGGMLLVTTLLALPARFAAERFASAERLLARASGALSLAFGLFLAYRIGFVDGLLLGD